MVKLEYDRDVDAAYIYLEYPLAAGAAAKTVELDNQIVLDLNTEGKVVGVEILNASKVLTKKVLVEAGAS